MRLCALAEVEEGDTVEVVEEVYLLMEVEQVGAFLPMEGGKKEMVVHIVVGPLVQVLDILRLLVVVDLVEGLLALVIVLLPVDLYHPILVIVHQ